MRTKRSKYNVDNSRLGRLKRTVDGITFASQAEATRYTVLNHLEMAGKISDLELQPRFEIIPAFIDAMGNRHRATHYTADFQYRRDGMVVIEEVKGKETRDFKLRMKLFLRKYPQFVYRIIKPKDVRSM